MFNLIKRMGVVAAMAAVLASTPVAHAQDSVVVNRAPLTNDQVRALEWYYGFQLQGGTYWYDPFSGLWGHEGGPSEGQIAPGLALGGPLRSDASNGHTGVFFNGRELHATEVQYLQRLFGAAPPGRYWLDANGTGGLEGGYASFSLAPRNNSSASPAAGNSFYYGGTIDRGYGGTYGSDGNCFYISTDAGDVLGPGC
jgi:hypothetical protein